MGVSTDAILVFGIPLEEGAIGAYDEDANAPEVGPAWMRFSGDDEDGVRIVCHCSDQCEMYIVGIASTEVTAWRGDPKRVEALLFSDAWAPKLQAFVDKYGLREYVAGEPGWYLASWWG